MTPRSQLDQGESSPLRRLFSAPQALDEIIDESEEGTTHIHDLVKAVADDHAGQEDLLKELLEALAQEGGQEETSRRDAAIVIMRQRPLGTFIMDHSDSVYQAYLEALDRQTPQNDPFGGSVYALLAAGMSMAPYLVLDGRKRMILKDSLSNLEKKFTRPDETAHIRSRIDALHENLSYNPRRDAIIEGLRLQGMKVGKIAGTLHIHPEIVKGTIATLIRQKRAERIKSSGRPAGSEALERDEAVRPLLRDWEDDEAQVERIANELREKKIDIRASIRRIRKPQKPQPPQSP